MNGRADPPPRAGKEGETGSGEEAAPAEGHSPASRARVRKAPTAFRTISEVAEDLHVPQHVLRFWETKFPQVRPLKRAGGRRYYRPADVALLQRIATLLYVHGYTIKGVQRLLRESEGAETEKGTEPETQGEGAAAPPHPASLPDPFRSPPLSPAVSPSAARGEGTAPSSSPPSSLSLSSPPAEAALRRLLLDVLAELKRLRSALAGPPRR
jgi:DNA-binding transcriptional MerR regulator